MKATQLFCRNYIQSRWCIEEFKMAHAHVKGGRKQLLIPIMLEDISCDDLDPDLQLYIKTYTYIKYSSDSESDDNLFKKKLIYAMPRKPLNDYVGERVGQGKSGLPKCQVEHLGDKMRRKMEERYAKQRASFSQGDMNTQNRLPGP